ncbi:hypothetical protein [Embleya sp. NPDC050493]|uniref:hypothetical protein n=1 Tax=Embleya sp. NPDC050493 TaxID=3363989 RepID=UPI00379C48D9
MISCSEGRAILGKGRRPTVCTAFQSNQTGGHQRENRSPCRPTPSCLPGAHTLLGIPLPTCVIDLRANQGCQQRSGITARTRQAAGERDHLRRKDRDHRRDDVRTRLTGNPGATASDVATHFDIGQSSAAKILAALRKEPIGA